MITSRAFAGRRYAVLGLARSGLATVEALVASGAGVTAWDEREDARDEAMALGAIAVAANHELVLLIIGGLFVVETASVIIQVFWFKRTGRRIFRMAPIHHHFEQLGWSESTVVIRFWIVSIVLALAGLATLKLR